MSNVHGTECGYERLTNYFFSEGFCYIQGEKKRVDQEKETKSTAIEECKGVVIVVVWFRCGVGKVRRRVSTRRNRPSCSLLCLLSSWSWCTEALWSTCGASRHIQLHGVLRGDRERRKEARYDRRRSCCRGSWSWAKLVAKGKRCDWKS